MSSQGQVIDPFTAHKTMRRALPDGEKAGFELEVKRLDQLIDEPRS